MNSDGSVYSQHDQHTTDVDAMPLTDSQGVEQVSVESFAPRFPLQDTDPDRIDNFWLDARLFSCPAGTAFVAHEDSGDAVMLLLLSEGAAEDAAARSRFSGEINAMHIDTVVARGGYDQDEGRMKVRFRPLEGPNAESSPILAPWVALAFNGSMHAVDEAIRVLHAVDLEDTKPLGKPAGPDFRLHWIDKAKLGLTRSWFLPWPGRKDRAGWITMATSFLLMVLITALALLLAILLFQNQPIVQVPKPIPSPAQGSGSPTSASANPSQNSSSPSQSPSASGDSGGPYSHSPSMSEPSGSSSGSDNPTRNSRL